MRWFFYAQNVTRRFIKYYQQRDHASLNVVSGSLAWKKTGRPNSMGLPSLLSSHQYSISTIINATKSSNFTSCSRSMKNRSNGESNDNSNKMVNLEVISRKTIKPASPTPNHLRKFNLSYFDQWFYDCYPTLIIFFPNNNKASAKEDVVKHLKETLSKILTRFYPFAGEVKDDLHIECSDKGVNFTEAQLNNSLKEFLRQPSDQKLRELAPESPRIGEPSIGNYIIGVQVNIFNCGGIGLSTSFTHKIFDGHTVFLFMQEWATAARGSPQTISPNLLAPEVFPNNPSQNYSWPSKFTNPESSCTKRFVFDSNSMALLKSQPFARTIKDGPTRMEATSALIWKVAAKASSTIKTFVPQSPHALFSFVNFRKRSSPPFPYESIGNLLRIATGICYPQRKPKLPTLLGEIRESIAKINSDHIESLKGEKGREAFDEIQKRLKDLMDVTEEGDNCLFVTSLLNSGIYEVDFGWGKPIWFYNINPGFTRIISLTDTLKGGGVEAIVTLTTSEMEIFEQDPELLSYATINPSPLGFLDG